MFQNGELITIVTRTVTGHDSLGDDTYSTVSTVVRGAFAPGGSVELVQGQDQVIIQPTVYLPPGAVVAPTDQVVVRGVTYDVDGSPNDYASPYTGWQPGVEVRLKAVTG